MKATIHNLNEARVNKARQELPSVVQVRARQVLGEVQDRQTIEVITTKVKSGDETFVSRRAFFTPKGLGEMNSQEKEEMLGLLDDVKMVILATI